MRFFIFLSIFLIQNACFAINKEIPDEFFKVLGVIESNNQDKCVGDNGLALGRYQIHKNYYLDAKKYDKTINFSYDSLTNESNARKVVIAYLSRYCKSNSFEDFARCHNAGPNYKSKLNKTNYYWQKFQKVFDKRRNNL
jgi:hypothetical protein